MRRPRLLWQVFTPALVIVVVSELILAGLASQSVRELSLASNREHLTSRAKLVARILAETGLTAGTQAIPADLDPLIDELGALTDARITVVARDGVVLGDSDEDPEAMVNHAERPEIKAAFAGEVGTALRWSATVGKEIQKTAVVAVLLALFGILVYVAVRYEFSFAVGAVVAIIHDVLMTTGWYCLSGREFNATTVAALLTIIGFSINDTIL